ncbi:MAG: hypothetical protein A2X49_07625 [Lentisphaerae bacterium GWF2_52_8]|nr:MAG: hypothetical protein A2X49_07625 [Lentisphaerae bacterium GWF2_52_8]
MEMNSLEIVIANLEHRNPPRPAFEFRDDKKRINDFACAGITESKTLELRRWTEGSHEYYYDEWGNLWWRMKDGCAVGEIKTAALENWSKLNNLATPDWDAEYRYAAMRETFSQNKDKFKLAFLPGWIFATSRYLRKMEIYFMDLIESPDKIAELHLRVASIIEKCIRQTARAGADGFIFCEDLGLQNRTMISPDMWREFFSGHYKQLTATAHESGLKVFMHSCGYNWDLLDDLADAGIDCFQFDQPASYDFAMLSEKLRRRKIALYSPVDIQKVLPTGNEKLIRAEARRMLENFSSGLIVKSYGDLPGIGVKPEWDKWAYEEFITAGGLKTV